MHFISLPHFDVYFDNHQDDPTIITFSFIGSEVLLLVVELPIKGK